MAATSATRRTRTVRNGIFALVVIACITVVARTMFWAPSSASLSPRGRLKPAHAHQRVDDDDEHHHAIDSKQQQSSSSSSSSSLLDALRESARNIVSARDATHGSSVLCWRLGDGDRLSRLDACEQEMRDVVAESPAGTTNKHKIVPLERLVAQLHPDFALAGREFLHFSQQHPHGGKLLTATKFREHAHKMQQLAASSFSSSFSSSSSSYDRAVEAAVTMFDDDFVAASVADALAELDPSTATLHADGKSAHNDLNGDFLWAITVRVDGSTALLHDHLTRHRAMWRSLAASRTARSISRASGRVVVLIMFAFPKAQHTSSHDFDVAVRAASQTFRSNKRCIVSSSFSADASVVINVRCEVPPSIDEYAARTPWCEDLSISFKSALKFGTKTGVYVGSVERFFGGGGGGDPARRPQLQLVKHYNILQYVHGFAAGLHRYLQDPVFAHPVIHVPRNACLTSHQKSASSYHDSVLQFQPLVSNQQSLTKLMKSHHRKHNELGWPIRMSLALQLMCAFSFLHAHPRGPFSFDDNHPDQYLVSEKRSSDGERTIDVELKMVDIDTLQQAVPAAVPFQSSRSKSQGIVPARAATHQPAWDANITFDERPRSYSASRSRGRRRPEAQQQHRHHHDDDAAPQQQQRYHTMESYELVCRCFYCRGRSNCLFVNSPEGYRACGQTGHTHDDGNGVTARGRERVSKRMRECTLLTDSWYLGQLLFFLIRGDLLFPAGVDMQTVIRAIDVEIIGSSSSVADNQRLEDAFSSVTKRKLAVSDSPAYNSIVYDLLIRRISPEQAALRLVAICESDPSRCKSGVTSANWCPRDYPGDVIFQGLRVAPDAVR